jgi:hypothetical protein
MHMHMGVACPPAPQDKVFTIKQEQVVVHRAVEDVLDLSNPLVRSFLSGPRSFLASLGRWLAYLRLLPLVGRPSASCFVIWAASCL